MAESRLAVMLGTDKQRARREFREALRNVGVRLEKEIRRTAPRGDKNAPGPYRRETGKGLVDSLRVVVRGDSVTVVSDAPHLLPLTKGFGPNFIFAKRAGGILAFPNKNFLLRKGTDTLRRRRSKAQRKGLGKGNLYKQYATHVLHPGAKPNRFLQKAVSKARKFLLEELRRLR